MSAKLSSDLDLLFYLQFLLFYLIGYFSMISANGVVTLDFIENQYQINPQTNFSLVVENKTFDTSTPFNRQVLETSKSLSSITRYTQVVPLILYWIVSPLLNYIFFFYWFFKKRKHLNTIPSKSL